MLTQQQFDALLKLVGRHEKIIDVLLGALTDHTCLLESRLDRCQSEGCKTAATVIHGDTKFKLCDHHAAAIVVGASHGRLGPNNDADLMLMRLRLANEDCWNDLPDAVRIRRIQDYVDVVKRNDDESLPAQYDQLH